MAQTMTVSPNVPRTDLAEPFARPYEPSWVDIVTGWVRRLPGPSWAFYLCVGSVLFFTYTAVKWADGSYPVGTFFPYHMISAANTVVFLALMHYLDDVAQSALDEFRPALEVSDEEFARIRYQLTTMPARMTWLATGIGLIVATILVVGFTTPQSNAVVKINTSPIATVFEFAFVLIGWPTWGVFLYHSVRQLRFVSHLYITAPHLDLFRPGPLYAFAGLSARTAIGWVVVPYGGIAAAPGVLDNPATALTVIPLTLLAAVIFAAPLLGVHRLLEYQKHRLQDALGTHLGTANIELQRRMQAQKYDELAGLKDGIQGLVAIQDELSKLRTWPWQPGTLRGFGAALLLPIVVWGVQRLLERLGF